MDSVISNLQSFFNDSVLKQFKDIVDVFQGLVDKVKLFVPAPLLPFVALGFVVSVIYLVIGRNND